MRAPNQSSPQRPCSSLIIKGSGLESASSHGTDYYTHPFNEWEPDCDADIETGANLSEIHEAFTAVDMRGYRLSTSTEWLQVILRLLRRPWCRLESMRMREATGQRKGEDGHPRRATSSASCKRRCIANLRINGTITRYTCFPFVTYPKNGTLARILVVAASVYPPTARSPRLSSSLDSHEAL